MPPYIGWVKENTLSFIVATTLARHKKLLENTSMEPFVFSWKNLHEKIECGKKYYLVGSFEDREIDQLAFYPAKIVAVGKIYGKKYFDMARPFRIGNIKVYPVPKSNASRGLEYLVALNTYFKVDRETKFFIKMLEKKPELAVVLSITEAWIPAYYLFTTFELVDNPKPGDIEHVIEYIKRTHGYYEKLEKMLVQIREGTIKKTRNYVAIYLEEEDPKKYAALSHRVFPRTPIIVLIGKHWGQYKTVFTIKHEQYPYLKKILMKKLGYKKIPGGKKRFTIYTCIPPEKLLPIIESAVRQHP